MSQIYLAIDYGTEGWNLKPYDSFEEALNAARQGTYGEWKILKEIDIGEIDDEYLACFV